MVVDNMPPHDDADSSDGFDWKTVMNAADLEEISGEQPVRIIPTYEGLYQFLAIFSFSLFIGLFFIQANMAWQSYQMLQRLSVGRGPVPDMVYHLYFDYLDWEVDPSKVDLRANTSIFVH